jgi:hypothetical protein
VDVRPLVEKLFGDIPAGKAEPEVASARLLPATRVARLPGINASVAVVAAIAPALDDTLHAPFYLSALLAGSWWKDQSGTPKPPLSSVFRYSLFDEPDLVRFYVQPIAGPTDTAAILRDWSQAMDELRAQQFSDDVLDMTRRSVDWFLGGPITPGILGIMRRDPAALAVLSSSMATRGCWRGDGFWDAWRERFETGRFSPQTYLEYMIMPGHQATLLMQPRR